MDMKCRECAYFSKAYIHSSGHGYDFGMRNYGFGICRRYGRAVYENSRACRRISAGCRGCTRCREVFIRTESGDFAASGNNSCSIWMKDVSRRRRHCLFYLPDERSNADEDAEQRKPKSKRFKFIRLIPPWALDIIRTINRIRDFFRSIF